MLFSSHWFMHVAFKRIWQAYIVAPWDEFWANTTGSKEEGKRCHSVEILCSALGNKTGIGTCLPSHSYLCGSRAEQRKLQLQCSCQGSAAASSFHI